MTIIAYFWKKHFVTPKDDYHQWIFNSASLSETISVPLRETKTQTRHKKP